MLHTIARLSLIAALVLSAHASRTSDKYHAVVMQERDSQTYYVTGHIDGFGAIDFMVDTGSGYVTINEKTLRVLKDKERVTYLRDLDGVMANGTRITVPVYLLKSLTIGRECLVHDVEVAVFPSDTRCILGMSALRKTAPFVFSTTPPTLMLSNCMQAVN
jgi:predicted aspartyl protease